MRKKKNKTKVWNGWAKQIDEEMQKMEEELRRWKKKFGGRIR